MVTVAASWSGSLAAPAAFVFPPPAARAVQVAVTNTPGDWLIAIVAWRQAAAGAGVSVSVADDAHNWWEPLGAPSGDSPAAGVTRCSVWAAPAARVANASTGATNVQVAASGPYQSLAVLILDVSGMLPWMTMTPVVTGYALAATSLPLAAAAPPAQALLVTVTGTDLNTATITGPGSGWTSLTPVTASNGADHTADIALHSAWQVTTGAATAAWGSSSALDMSAVIAGVLVSAAQPAQPNPMWPVVITEAAPGSGAQTPPAQLSWTPLSARALSCSIQQGRQYTAAQLQAGQGTMTLDNPDGYLIPPGNGAYLGIDSGTPVRQRVVWTGGAWQLTLTPDGVTSNPYAQSAHLPASQLTTYLVSAWAYVPQGWAGGASIIADWYNGGTSLTASSVTVASLPAGTPVLIEGGVTSPATATAGKFTLQLNGLPAASVVLYAAAAPPAAVSLMPPAPTAWTGGHNATIATLAPWQADPRGIPNVSPWYVPYSGYFLRWPFAADAQMLRGQTQATITDAWGYAAGALNSMAREEMLLDAPYALWPLSDPAGSAQGSNIAPGNASPLALTLSKYGSGGGSAAFGANSGAILGDSAAKVTSTGKGGAQGMFSQALAGSALGANGYGSALVCVDPAYPPIANGVTIECWFDMQLGLIDSFTAATAGSLFTATGATSLVTGQAVVLIVASGFTLPGGFSAGVVYYVTGASGSTFQLSATPGGSAITVTSSGAGYVQPTLPWNPVILSARNVRGLVVELDVRNTDGALLLLYRPATGGTTTVVLDAGHDYRIIAGMSYASVAFNTTSYRVVVVGSGVGVYTGAFGSALAGSFFELDFCGIQDRAVQGYAWTGYLALAAVYPLMLSLSRQFSHYLTGATGAANEAACDRIERVLEYAGLAGRRWLGQQPVTYEGDLCVSGQDIGGQSAAASAGNISSSTLPAMLYVAPTGDIFYMSKLYSWNQPLRWVLGDSAATGEIPFQAPSFSTDYDPARLLNDVQLTQLDTQSVTVPSGVMASATVAAVELASQAQYGDQPYQQTGYMTADASSAYSAGGSMVDLANWIANVYAKPRNRVQAITVDAARNPAAWPFWAGASVGDMVQVNLRLPTAVNTPIVSVFARITQTTRDAQFMQDGTRATITCVLDAAPEYNALICDDPVRGLLNGSNVLAW